MIVGLPLGSRLFFAAGEDIGESQRLWVSDGTAAGTFLVAIERSPAFRRRSPIPRRSSRRSLPRPGASPVAFPPTGRTFAITQTHWFRVRDGRVLEHWANRDDLGMAEQAGWVPPSPAYLLRMALAKRRARKAA